MRRAAGVGAIKNKNLAQARYKGKGNELAQDELSEMASHMEKFKHHLQQFASKHRDDIRKNSEFRLQFQEMCAAIGVDPLASSRGFWSELLGVGDFYYELAVQIIEICMATSKRNGGLMKIHELQERLEASRGSHAQGFCIFDLGKAIRTLEVLGNGFSIVEVGDTQMVQSVPMELTLDHSSVLRLAQESGHVNQRKVVASLQWEEERASRCLEFMVKEGLAWVDRQGAARETEYWFPTFFQECSRVGLNGAAPE